MDENVVKAIEDLETIEKIISNYYTIDESRHKVADFIFELKGRYSVIIKNFNNNMEKHYNRVSSSGMAAHSIDYSKISKDLNNIKGILDSFIRNKGNLNYIYDKETNSVIINNQNVNTNTNTNTNLTDIKLEQIIDNISNNSSIPQREIDEIINKLREIEEIAKSNDKKPMKWQKIKDITKNLLDKGLDIGINVLPYIIRLAKGL